MPNDVPFAHVERERFDAVIISPGPGHPANPTDVGLSAHVCTWIETPLLGVCLGHQLLGHISGAKVERSPMVRHGYVSEIRTTSHWLFESIPQGFSAVRYHSWHLTDVPPGFDAIAHAEDGVLMAMCHRDRPHVGVQFHPESIDTDYGTQLIKNFLRRYLNLPSSEARIRDVLTPCLLAPNHKLHIYKLDWHSPETVVDALRHSHEELIWLDSSLPSTEQQQVSYVYAHHPLGERWLHNPYDNSITVRRNGEDKQMKSDLFDAMKTRLLEVRLEPTDAPFSFKGGFIGSLSYEARWSQQLKSNESRSCVYFADRFLVFDHHERAMYAAFLGSVESAMNARVWFEEVRTFLGESSGTTTTKPLNREVHDLGVVPKSRYSEQIRQCKSHLLDGESYELCLTTEVTLSAPTCPWSYYIALRLTNPAPYSAYLQLPNMVVACSSPEKFISVDATGLIEAKPIKGTRARGATLQADAQILEGLRQSEKDRAENLMITDLLRHDVGAHAELGSVSVPHNRAIESYATLHQMVSTIRGHKRADRSAVDVVRDAFPGGSMTGAPKHRSVKLLGQIEQRERGVYSGSLGFFSVCGQSVWNIVIRTAIIEGDTMKIGAGGAIVMASDPNDEYQEMLVKVFPLLRPLGFESVAELASILRNA